MPANTHQPSDSLASDPLNRSIYILVYPSRLFAAHWSFWLPHIDEGDRESDIGDRIHVTGDRLNGFQYEYVVDYNVTEDDRQPHAFPIGLVPEIHLRGVGYCDRSMDRDMEVGPWNAFDRACREVAAPGPSLNKVAPTHGTVTRAEPPRRAEVKDCQWWVKKAVSHLVEAGMLLPLADGAEASPVAQVESLPRH